MMSEETEGKVPSTKLQRIFKLQKSIFNEIPSSKVQRAGKQELNHGDTEAPRKAK
jgi:hypothetical protein